MAGPGGDRSGPYDVASTLRAVDSLLPLVAHHADAANRSFRPAQLVMDAFAAAGLLKLLPPVSYGGGELDPDGFLRVVERIAEIDPSTAWAVMTTNEEAEIASAYLPAATLRAVFGADPPPVIAGSGVPAGRAVPTEGGWLVNGRWRFVTASPAAALLVVCALVDGPPPRRLCYCLVPAAAVTIMDSWRVAGMAGTGSNDVVFDDVFVPASHAAEVATALDTVADSPFFRLPPGLRFPFPKVGVASGAARGAIDAFVELAATKAPGLGRSLLNTRPDAQLAVAEAEARWGAGRALVRERLAEVWALALADQPVPPELHARTRLACSAAVAGCVTAVELLCTAAGTSANELGSPLQRRLADVRAVGQHFMVGGYHLTTAGRVLLGLDPEDPTF